MLPLTRPYKNLITTTTSPNLTLLRHSFDSSKPGPLPEAKDLAKKILTEFPQEPTECCMSGCANCVWIDYADKLTEYYKDGGEMALKEIEKKVTDPTVRIFILNELKMKLNR